MRRWASSWHYVFSLEGVSWSSLKEVATLRLTLGYIRCKLTSRRCTAPILTCGTTNSRLHCSSYWQVLPVSRARSKLQVSHNENSAADMSILLDLPGGRILWSYLKGRLRISQDDLPFPLSVTSSLFSAVILKVKSSRPEFLDVITPEKAKCPQKPLKRILH